MSDQIKNPLRHLFFAMVTSCFLRSMKKKTTANSPQTQTTSQVPPPQFQVRILRRCTKKWRSTTTTSSDFDELKFMHKSLVGQMSTMPNLLTAIVSKNNNVYNSLKQLYTIIPQHKKTLIFCQFPKPTSQKIIHQHKRLLDYNRQTFHCAD